LPGISLVDLDLRFADDGTPFIHFGVEKRSKLLRRRTDQGGAELLQPLFTMGWPSAATVSALILPMMSCGVLAGTNKANQVETSNPGTPASAMVGSSAAATRFAAVTANPRTAPFFNCGKLAVMLSKMTSRRPAMTSCNAGAAPR